MLAANFSGFGVGDISNSAFNSPGLSPKLCFENLSRYGIFVVDVNAFLSFHDMLISTKDTFHIFYSNSCIFLHDYWQWRFYCLSIGMRHGVVYFSRGEDRFTQFLRSMLLSCPGSLISSGVCNLFYLWYPKIHHVSRMMIMLYFSRCGRK